MKLRYSTTFIICLVLSVLLFSGCGSGGGSSSGPGFQFTLKGYPDVSGTYSVSLGKLTNNCGAQEVPPQNHANMMVTQSEGNITFQTTNDSTIKSLEAAGFTIVSESDMSGTIAKDANFQTTRGVTLHHDTLGNFYINYAMNGKFTTTGFSGSLGYTAFDDFGNSCTVTGSISGKNL